MEHNQFPKSMDSQLGRTCYVNGRTVVDVVAVAVAGIVFIIFLVVVVVVVVAATVQTVAQLAGEYERAAGSNLLV